MNKYKAEDFIVENEINKVLTQIIYENKGILPY